MRYFSHKEDQELLHRKKAENFPLTKKEIVHEIIKTSEDNFDIEHWKLHKYKRQNAWLSGRKVR